MIQLLQLGKLVELALSKLREHLKDPSIVDPESVGKSQYLTVLNHYEGRTVGEDEWKKMYQSLGDKMLLVIKLGGIM